MKNQIALFFRRHWIAFFGTIFTGGLVLGSALLFFMSAAATGPSAATRQIQGWVNQLGEQKLTPERHAAQQQLELAGPAAVDPLISALASPNPILRGNAAEMLGFIPSPRALPPLVDLMQTDPDPAVRNRAACTLGELNDVRAVEPLERAAVLDADTGVRTEALGSLAALRTHFAVAAGRDAERVGAFTTASAASRVVFLAQMNKIFVSRDGGATWLRVGGPLPSRIRALAASQANSQLVFAGTDTRGLLKSADGGTTWNAVNEGLAASGAPVAVTAIALDPSNPSNIYIALAAWVGGSQASLLPVGIRSSQDGGSSWQVVQMPATRWAVSRLALAGGRLYALDGDQIVSASVP